MQDSTILCLAAIGGFVTIVSTIAATVGLVYVTAFKQTHLNYRKELEYKKAMIQAGSANNQNEGGTGFDMMSIMGLLQNPVVQQAIQGLASSRPPVQQEAPPATNQDVI